MSFTALSTLSLTGFRAIAPEHDRGPRFSALGRLHAWLVGKSRSRLATAARALLHPHLPGGRHALVLTLDCERSTPAAHLARLRVAATGSIDAVATVGALTGAGDVGLMLAEIKRVLRPAGRLLFVEPVAARAGTRFRRLQGFLNDVWAMMAGTASPPRDLWNDLKAARFAGLRLDHVNLAGIGGIPVPHLVGEAVLSAESGPPMTPPRAHATGVPGLAWRQPASAFFGR